MYIRLLRLRTFTFVLKNISTVHSRRRGKVYHHMRNSIGLMRVESTL